MSTYTIYVEPNTDLRKVLNQAYGHEHVRIVLESGHHTWFFDSNWQYDEQQGWYPDGEPDPGVHEHLVMDHPDLEVIGDETCTFPPHHVWYDPSRVKIDPRLKNLHTIMYYNYKGTIFARCGDVVPADWLHVSNIFPGELVKIMDIEMPYDDESCWEGVQELSQEARDKLTEVFPEPFETLSDIPEPSEII